MADLSGPAGMGTRFDDMSRSQLGVVADFVREAMLMTLSQLVDAD
jgi:hypothetical protein